MSYLLKQAFAVYFCMSWQQIQEYSSAPRSLYESS